MHRQLLVCGQVFRAACLSALQQFLRCSLQLPCRLQPMLPHLWEPVFSVAACSPHVAGSIDAVPSSTSTGARLPRQVLIGSSCGSDVVLIMRTNKSRCVDGSNVRPTYSPDRSCRLSITQLSATTRLGVYRVERATTLTCCFGGRTSSSCT
jgi:hypothetical protein